MKRTNFATKMMQSNGSNFLIDVKMRISDVGNGRGRTLFIMSKRARGCTQIYVTTHLLAFVNNRRLSFPMNLQVCLDVSLKKHTEKK